MECDSSSVDQGISLPLVTSGTSGTHRRWVMTIFDCDGTRREKLETLPHFVEYMAYGDEVTKEGKKHYQCFVYTKKIRWSAFSEWIGNAYRAPMRGTFKDNEAYCSKQGQLKEFGERPDQGKRSDLLSMKRKLEERSNVSVYDIAEDEEYFPVIAKHSRFAEKYLNHYHGKRASNNDPVEVIYIYGKPGSGKTRYVRDLEPDVYDVPADDLYKWRDGYSLHEAVLFDNVEPQNIHPSRLLKDLDRYKIQVPTKGSFVTWKPKRAYITSTFAAEVVARRFADPQEFLRRITVYKEL